MERHPAKTGPSPAVAFGPDRIDRTEMKLHKATFEYDCVECHDAQKRDPSNREFIGEHGKLQFDHGINNRCFNCHHQTEYDKFVGPDGRPIPFQDHVKLCATCHGTQYRDWRGGAHGRRSGYWDKTRGEQRRTDCLVCHDAHRPAFQPIVPLPAPGVEVGVPFSPHGAHSAYQRLLQEQSKTESKTETKDTLREAAPRDNDDSEFLK